MVVCQSLPATARTGSSDLHQIHSRIFLELCQESFEFQVSSTLLLLRILIPPPIDTKSLLITADEDKVCPSPPPAPPPPPPLQRLEEDGRQNLRVWGCNHNELLKNLYGRFEDEGVEDTKELLKIQRSC